MKGISSIIILLLPLISSCSTLSYYSQSVKGHMQVWWPSLDIEELLQDPNLSDEKRKKFKTVLAARSFASQELKLPDNGSYREYTDLGRKHVVWNVIAAQEFSVTPKNWCYLIVGCVSYRGYYDENTARNYAAALQQQGYDVHVGGVDAYSTLGWFDDPLLNTMMNWNDFFLAGLIFHELSHQVLYISSDAEFNEAFATAVEQIGMRQWLQQREPDKIEAYEKYLDRIFTVKGLLYQTKLDLKKLYASPVKDEEKRKKKQARFDKLRQDYQTLQKSWGKYKTYQNWFSKPINNARLGLEMTYLQRVPAFEAMFKQNKGDWEKFYRAVKDLTDLTKAQREAYLNKLVK